MRQEKTAAQSFWHGKKRRILLISCLLLLGISVSGTLAFLFTQTEEKENIFHPAHVACEVVETFADGVKRDVKIKNTGETDAFIRVAIVATWMAGESSGDQTVTARVPEFGKDYTIDWSAGVTDGTWLEGGDGYYYYTLPVSPNGETINLIDRCTLLPGASVPDGFHLSVEIVASAVQSAPSKAAESAWGVAIADGKITAVPDREVRG